MTELRDSSWRRGRCHALWQHQHGFCFHCGGSMPDPLVQRARHRKRADAATIDHVLPRSLGGMAAWLNEVAACRACNAIKADRPPLAVELWRLVWLKGDSLLLAHALEPAALTALLQSGQQEVAGTEDGVVGQRGHGDFACGAIAIGVERNHAG